MSKIAVLLIHGIGRHKDEFHCKTVDVMKRLLEEAVAERLGIPDASDVIVVRYALWGNELQLLEDALWTRMGDFPLRLRELRRLLIDYVGDAILYQLPPGSRDGYKPTYDRVHDTVRGELTQLAERTQADAPLVVIGHSLGSIIASNLLYDLNKQYGDPASTSTDPTPLEQGNTLVSLYTMGSPLAIYLSRLSRIDEPVRCPAARASEYITNIENLPVGWVNFYDRHDIAAYPLSPFAGYEFVEDKEVAVGGVLGSIPPWAHTEYWSNRETIARIADDLVAIWRGINTVTMDESA